MPNIVSEPRCPSRPFSIHATFEIGTFEKLFEELQVQSIDISMPRESREGSVPDFCYVRIRTSMGSVEVKAQTFREAFEAALDSIDKLQLSLRARRHK